MFSYEYVVPQGGSRTTDANTPIVRHKLDILTSVLADFIQMGHTMRGAQNLADTKVDLFMQAVEGWLDDVAAIINKDGLTRLWALNGLDPALMPEFVPDMAQQIDLDILSNFILRLSQAGVQMFPDEDLEDYVRDAAGLPDAMEGRPWEAQLQQQAGDEAKKQPAKSAAKSIIKAMMGNQLKRKRK
jgi:phage gp29-like protein